MNLSTYIGIAPIVAGLGLASLGGGEVSEPPVTAGGQVIAVTIAKPDSFTSFNDRVNCWEQGDGSHPYLVLDRDANGHNEHRFGRHATFNTGDGKDLGLFEHVVPQGGVFVPESGYFDFAHVAVEIDGAAGHGSITLYCAKTPEAANQR